MMGRPLTALVTGGNRGLGLEVGRQLAARGYRVVLASRQLAAGQAAAAQLQAAGGEVVAQPLDLTDPASVAGLCAWVGQTWGAVDVLVNNAGVFLDREASVLTLPLETLQRTLDTNVFGAWRLCQAVLPGMRERGYGRIVNVSSGLGQMDRFDDYAPAYRLSKLALNGLTRMLADAVKGRDVLVNAVSPGWVRTDMGGPGAPRGVEQGASGIVWAATLPAGGPSGGFFQDGQPLAW